MTEKFRLGFVGLTHLGLCQMAAAAAHGFECLGLGEAAAVDEPGLTDILSAHADRIEFTLMASRLMNCDLVFVTYDVNDDAADLHGAAECLIKAQRHSWAPIVVVSQVPPGWLRARASPGRVYYSQLDTLIMRRSMDRALRPHCISVGVKDLSHPLAPQYERYLAAFGCPILRMTYESCEFAKVAINFLLAANVTATNVLNAAALSVGANWPDFEAAIRADPRFGAKAYVTPGEGFSGSHLTRDVLRLERLCTAYKIDGAVVRAIIKWQMGVPTDGKS